ncbi:MAG: serine O-acetyltransferase [Mariprofundus sp.]|nr:serine O-acetyltransferase [Mariprofundus sp.]
MLDSIREDIRTAFDRDPAVRSSWEVLTCYPGLHAIWFYRVAHACWQYHFFWLGRFISHLARWMTGVEIHPGAIIGKRFFIDHGMGIVIGETTEIGDDVTLYHGVTLGGTTWQKVKRHPTLESGVIVGAGAKVLGAITIGEQSRIGANSVVFHDVPAHSTVVGIPGTVVGSTKSLIENGKINLDHHLLANPVAEALRHVIKMIDDVNARVDTFHHRPTDDEQKESKELDKDRLDEQEKLERFLGGGI